MTIGTGIGGAVIIDGKIHNGCCNSAGEIGHTIIEGNSLIIEGNSFQDLASTSSLVKKVARLKNMDYKDLNGKIIFEEAKAGDEICILSLKEMIRVLALGISNVKVARLKNMDYKDLNGKIIFEEAKAGDEICILSLKEMIRVLALGISNVAYLVNPDTVILGGGIMAQEEYIRPILDEELKKILVERVYENTRIEFAYMKNSAGMIGALRNFLNKHVEE